MSARRLFLIKGTDMKKVITATIYTIYLYTYYGRLHSFILGKITLSKRSHAGCVLLWAQM